MADKTTDAEVTRRAAELVRAMNGTKAKEANEEARTKLSPAELTAAEAMGMGAAEYLRYKSPRPEAA